MSYAKDCNIKIELNYKIPVLFHNLKSYDSRLIIQELSNFNSKTSVIKNGLEKCMIFNIKIKLAFTEFFIGYFS